MQIQNLFKDPKTNWKYILLIVILTAIIGGGIYFYKTQLLCIKEGETTRPPLPPPILKWLEPTKCCNELKMIAYSGLFDENCNEWMPLGAPSNVCTKCGDGECGKGETKCNCPEDCAQPDKTANWQTYRNEEYGFELKYPSKYTFSQSQNVETCSFFSKSRSANCTFINFNNSEKDLYNLTDWNLYIFDDIFDLVIYGQITEVYFDLQEKTWKQEWAGMEKETLRTWNYTKTGDDIFKFESGGSHGASLYYLIPNYQKNFAVVFQIPSARRLRCDLMTDSEEQSYCISFLKSLHEKYADTEIGEDWVPPEYFKSLHEEIERAILNFFRILDKK